MPEVTGGGRREVISDISLVFFWRILRLCLVAAVKFLEAQ
jgi:hypothetical protein